MPRSLLAALVASTALLLTTPAHADTPPDGGTPFAPAPRSQDRFDVAPPNGDTQHNVEAEDGTQLYVETYLPEQRAGGPPAPERVPIVLISTPYDSLYQGTGYYAAIDHLVQRGYGVAVQHVRGTGNSGGCLEQTAAKQIDDTARVIHFLGTEVPYTDGNVGMYGVSYDAETQTSVAGLGKPELIAPLKAIIPLASVGGQYEYSNYDGVPFEQQALVSNTTYFPISLAPGLASPGQQAPQQKLACQPEIFEASLDESGDMTEFWRQREYRPGAPNVRAATLYVHGLRDFNVLPQTIRGWFDELPASTPSKGLFGVWDHAEPDGHSVEPDWQRGDWLAMVTAWYDRWLKGLDSGVESWPEVQVQDNSGRWRDAPGFPLSGPAGQLALAADGGLGTTRAPAGKTTFAEDDEEGVTFTTAPVAGPLSVTGQPVADLWLTSSEPDAHLAAELEVLGADGEPLEQSDGTPVATYGLRSLRHLDPIQRGWFNQAEGRDAPAGTPIRVPLRFLPTDLVVPAGGSLRLRLTGLGSEPRTALASGAGSELSVLHDCTHTSALRFLEADPAAPQLNVREIGESGAELRSEPRAIGTQDGGGLAAGAVCDRAAVPPDAVLTAPDVAPPLAGSGDAGAGAGPAAETPAAGAAASAAAARCGSPTSRFARLSRVTRRGLRLRGTASARGCRVRRVSVAVARKAGRRCQFLRADGSFGPARSCLRTQYLTARGTSSWSLTRRLRLARGSYLVWSRAISSAGAVERKAARRNLLRQTIRR